MGKHLIFFLALDLVKFSHKKYFSPGETCVLRPGKNYCTYLPSRLCTKSILKGFPFSLSFILPPVFFWITHLMFNPASWHYYLQCNNNNGAQPPPCLKKNRPGEPKLCNPFTPLLPAHPSSTCCILLNSGPSPYRLSFPRCL